MYNNQLTSMKRLAGFRRLNANQVQRLQKTQPDALAAIEQGLQELAQADYADRRSQIFHQRIRYAHKLPISWSLPIRIVIAGIGALICSASVQTTTLTLPRWIQTPATPLIAGMFVLGSEELARRVITGVRLKQLYLQEAHRVLEVINRAEEYPLEILWQEEQLELLHKTEAGTWPYLEALVLGLIFLMEAGSALFWVASESFVLATFAAVAPISYVLLAAVLLSHFLDCEDALEPLAATYEEYLSPQTLSPELGQIAVPNLGTTVTPLTLPQPAQPSSQPNGAISESSAD